MIRGAVNSRLEAVVRLRVRGPGGVEADVDAVLDTGFTSSLTLPPAVVAALALARQSGGSALVADGSVRPFDICAAEVDWGGTWRPVLVWVVGDEVLLGMGLLARHQVRVEAVPGSGDHPHSLTDRTRRCGQVG
jgi:clan AA aspartic protease